MSRLAVQFIAVVGVALAAAAVLVMREPRSMFDMFPADTWACTNSQGKLYYVGWIPKNDGVMIFIHVPQYVEFFDLSCVPDGRGTCDYGDEGWDQVAVEVIQPAGTQTISFDRKTPQLKGADFRHHAHLYGDRALQIVNAFYSGRSAHIAIRAKKGRLLYVQKVNLNSFRAAFDDCLARWKSDLRLHAQPAAR